MELKNVANKLRIKDLHAGSYVRTEGQFEPNYLTLGDRKISRVNVIAVIVSNEEAGLVLDDGSGRIEARVMPGSEIRLHLRGLWPWSSAGQGSSTRVSTLFLRSLSSLILHGLSFASRSSRRRVSLKT